MSTFIDNIFDKIGNVILPKTVTKAVWGQTSGNRLDQELDGIEAALAQPNTGTNADRAYSAGKYIYHVKNKELYKAKSNIASGAAFNKASGGNVDVVNIGDQLQTISSDLASHELVGIGSGTGRVTVQSYQAFKWGNLVFLSVLAKVTGNAIDTTTTIIGVSIGGQTVTFNRILWSYFSFTADAIGSPSVRLDSTNKYLTQQASSSIATNSMMQIMAILELP